MKRKQILERITDVEEFIMIVEQLLHIKDSYEEEKYHHIIEEELEYIGDYLETYIDQDELEDIIRNLRKDDCSELERLYEQALDDLKALNRLGGDDDFR